jgi:cytoskeletal protein CcmA (bactofilin family)
MDNKVDLKIYGQGNSCGGNFKDVIIKGNGQINGAVNCRNYNIYGNGDIIGDLNADAIIIKGQAEFEGDVEANELKIQGEVRIKGDLSTEEAVITGNLKSNGDFNAENCKFEGGFEIDGLLNADKLEINMYWPCKVLEIGGTTINVKNDNKFSILGIKNIIMPQSQSRLLIVDSIEADDIYLENTTAKIVRGKNIELGPDCHVDLLEYQEKFKDHEKSNVEKVVNI